MPESSISCPLCYQNERFQPVRSPDERVHFHCLKCKLIFTDKKYRLSGEDEKARYEEHNNGIQYPGYVNFLNQALEPTLPHLTTDMRGLDFGCGPVPTLSVLLKEKNISCEDYDPIFLPRSLTSAYDFIFATECFEHFSNPAKELTRLKTLLKPGGYLTVMTIQWKTLDEFSTWHYARDPTHISFYHRNTFHFICKHYGFELIPTGNKRVIILKLNT